MNVIYPFLISFFLCQSLLAQMTYTEALMNPLKAREISLHDGDVLDKRIKNLKNLEKISFGSLKGKKESHIPKEIRKLKKLRILTFYNVIIDSELTLIEQLTNIEIINFQFCEFKQPFPSLEKMKKLRKLSIVGPGVNIEAVGFQKLENLESLLVQSDDLKKLPESICDARNLTSVNFDLCGSLKELPVEFGALLNLKRLHLTWSGIHKLPSSIHQLKNLEHLEFGEMRGSLQLPQNIGELESLRSIHMRGRIESFPQSFYKLKNLRSIHLFQPKILPRVSKLCELLKLQDFTVLGEMKEDYKKRLKVCLPKVTFYE